MVRGIRKAAVTNSQRPRAKVFRDWAHLFCSRTLEQLRSRSFPLTAGGALIPISIIEILDYLVLESDEANVGFPPIRMIIGWLVQSLDLDFGAGAS
jgi:hypothetical protein